MGHARLPQLAEAANNCRLRKKRFSMSYMYSLGVSADSTLVALPFALG